MNRISDRKQVKALALLFSVTYMISYITRVNFGAIVSEMENATGIARSALSLSLTGTFITYGVGQIVSGILGDKFSPKKVVSVGFIITTLMNILLPLFENPYIMLVIWSINGFAQAFIWPPLIKLMATLLSEEDYGNTVTKVIWGSSAGSIIVYLVAPFLISLFGWKSVFFFSAFCGIVILFFWNKYSYEIEVEKNTVFKEKSSVKVLFTPMMLVILLAVIIHGMLKDGIVTWMPTYISETYNVSSVISILTGVLLPIFSVICAQIASNTYIHIFKNPILCAGVMFGFGAVSGFFLYFLSDGGLVFSVIFTALLTGFMQGVNMMLVCMLPAFFNRFNIVSTASGVINASAYIGISASTYGNAILSQTIGWKYTILIWALLGVIGTLLCFASVRPWRKNMYH